MVIPLGASFALQHMVISIALLGYGASGAFFALVGDGLRCHLGAIWRPRSRDR
jgi:hypothetical protein